MLTPAPTPKARLTRGSVRVLILGGLLPFLTFGESNTCFVNRAAFDIGSGTTKFQIAYVNRCSNQVVKKVFEKDMKVSFKEALLHNQNRFNERIIQEGIFAINFLKKEGSKVAKVDEYSGVATSAFREAQNGNEALRRLSQETKVPLRTIAQRDEGILGYYAVHAATKKPLTELIVWDIGGGSSQITYWNPLKNALSIKKPQTGSVPFKNWILTSLQRKKEARSPNPISSDTAKKAYQKAKDLGAAEKNTGFSLALKRSSDVYGIGGVHFYSIRNQLGPVTTYESSQLEKAFQERLGKNDEALGGQYASTDVSNLLLVRGIMDGLGIRKVSPIKINMTDGILINPAYWTPPPEHTQP